MQLSDKFEIGKVYELEFSTPFYMSPGRDVSWTDYIENGSVVILLVLEFVNNNLSMKCLWKNKIVYFGFTFIKDYMLYCRKLS